VRYSHRSNYSTVTSQEFVMASSLKLVVIGGVAAGLKAACKTARLQPQADITVLEKAETLSYSGCGLPYFVSGVVPDREELFSTPAGAVRDPAFFEAVKNVKVRNRTEAVAIDRANKKVEYRNLVDGRTGSITYDKLVVATGARPVVPPIPGVDLANVFKVKQVEDAERIRAAVESSETKRAVIIGGGLIGMEMAESLASCGWRGTWAGRRSPCAPASR
jgi:NADPH-dependent 2,4-dienoyl-CoA reductase/sulfur reductase-like enzyme